MTPDGSRIGRQPNSVKHKTMLELVSLRARGLETEVSLCCRFSITQLVNQS